MVVWLFWEVFACGGIVGGVLEGIAVGVNGNEPDGGEKVGLAVGGVHCFCPLCRHLFRRLRAEGTVSSLVSWPSAGETVNLFWFRSDSLLLIVLPLVVRVSRVVVAAPPRVVMLFPRGLGAPCARPPSRLGIYILHEGGAAVM